MKKTLVISGHPNLRGSYVNRLILEELKRYPSLSIHDIKSTYPRGLPAAEAEQSKLQEASMLVLQFPFIWYGIPSHMKAWMEQVFAPGFAFGPGGDALKNKKLLLSVTLGGSPEAYGPGGMHEHPVETFLRPLEQFARYCGLDYLPPLYSYSMTVDQAGSELRLQQKALQHARRLLELIHLMSA